ncbi:transcriptional repressor LexA [Oligella urethralis]|uniref:transcriptional repressor LexA n=1 Tax=Oligella TaxID=90243 RepID=UPI0003A7CF4E|nr:MULTISPECIES: transcriptional repressor LexA [Oligella]MDK6203016.1 transcriptional repressor LexA [Oligella urethralis]OFV47162.1 repressor LexA [Oligella sp. HMSC09E12]PMC17119.1 transcriptional repressor LexA [Oligella urethralis]SUA59640.1 LexA repressor [Oligella urethralis]SUA60196.1 LexA repressor [Oligella urethralis]
MSIKLTARQQEVFDLIQASIRRTGFPPTRAEIAQSLGFRSANAAEDHLKALAKKGAIILTPGTSRGIRLNPDLEATTPATASAAAAELSERLTTLPLIGRVAAGSPILAQAHIEKEIPVDPAMFEDKADYLLRVRGESMIDIGIYDGDLLAVKKSQSAHNGQIIVARINDDVTVKRFQKGANRITLIAENQHFAPIIVTPQDEFAIEGLAVGLIRSLN